MRFGISPGNYSGDGGGVVVGGLTPGAAAETAGVQEGDRLLTWNGEEIEDVRAWMGMLRKHEPGDEVLVGIDRADERIELEVSLQGTGAEPGVAPGRPAGRPATRAAPAPSCGGASGSLAALQLLELVGRAALAQAVGEGRLGVGVDVRSSWLQ